MNVRRAIMAAVVMIFGLAFQARAEDSAGRKHLDEYLPPDVEMLQAQLNKMQKEPLTQTDLHAFSGKIHNVNVLTVPPSSPNVIPAADRPTGPLQLNKVVIVDPTSN